MAAGSRPSVAARRLVSQRLVGDSPSTAAGALSCLCAVQAQDYAGAKWALGMRSGATDAEVEDAYTSGAILRTHVLRPTWHFVAPADIRWLLGLTAPRVRAANAYMYRKLALDAPTLRRSDAAIARALAGGRSRTRDELRVVLEKARVSTDGELRMGYLMMHAELEALVCSGPRRGNQFTYALFDERVVNARTLDRDDALAELTHRYFSSRGPATVHDFAKWSGLTVTDAKHGIASVETRLACERLDDTVYWFDDAVDGPGSKPRASAHLLSIYDEYVSSYKDRSAIGDANAAARLQSMGNALTAIVVVDGRVRGVWRRTVGKARVSVRLDLFDKPTKVERRAIDDAIERYERFLGAPVVIE